MFTIELKYNPQSQIQFTEFDRSTDFIVYPYIMIDDHGFDGNHIPNIPNTNHRPN